MEQNEIRDFIANAPARWRFDGYQMVNNDEARRHWLSDISRGSIHQRINRRAGYVPPTAPFYAPWRGAYASISRHHRREMKRLHPNLHWVYRNG